MTSSFGLKSLCARKLGVADRVFPLSSLREILFAFMVDSNCRFSITLVGDEVSFGGARTLDLAGDEVVEARSFRGGRRASCV